MRVGRVQGCAAAVTVGLAVAMALGSTGAVAKQPKPGTWKPTVVTVKEVKDGIGPASTAVVDAHCPAGFSVFGGSYVIGGDSVLAHAAGAAPFYNDNLYRVIVVNPPTSPYVRAQDASVTVAALCAVDGTPLVVNGPFPSTDAEGSGLGGVTIGPIGSGLPATVVATVSGGTVANGAVQKIDSTCRSARDSVFSGGYTLDGSLFADAASAAVLSKTGSYSATVVNPGVNPSLGVTNSPATVRVAVFCTHSGRPIVMGAGAVGASARAVTAKASKKRSPRPPGSLRATVILKRASVGGITAGTINSADAKCPSGYSVFGGSYLIGGNSVLAHATVAAVLSKANSYSATVVNPPVNVNTGVPRSTATLTVAAECAKNATPVVVDGAFGNG